MFSRRFAKVSSLFLLLVFLLTTGVSCSRGGSQAAREALQPLTLRFWSVHDDSAAYADIIADYRRLHPNVTIEYRKLRPEEYETELLEAFARDEGPDIFSFHNTWTQQYQDLLEPMPASVRLPFVRTTGTVRQEQVVELVTQNLYSSGQVEQLFGDTVLQDTTLVDDQGVARMYGLPLALDTLALYYNKDILNNAGIALPATYWTDFQAQVETITRRDDNNNILLAAAPIGTADNVPRSFDILSLLMMQLQAEMIDERGRVQFHQIPPALSGQEGITQPPGINALEFYTSFADPQLASYTWNSTMPDGLQSFINGRSAYFFGYAYHRPVIEAAAPGLNYAIAPMLQIQGYDRLNYANYWLQGVSSKSQHKDFAWDFVRFMTSAEEATKYLEETKRPTAIRTLYDSQLLDEEVTVFTDQTLTAKSWYRGRDAEAAEDIFGDMITAVNEGRLTAREAIGVAVQQIEQTLR